MKKELSKTEKAVLSQSAKWLGRAISAPDYKMVDYSTLTQAKKLSLLEAAMHSGKPIDFSEQIRIELDGLYGIEYLAALKEFFAAFSLSDIVMLLNAEFKPTKEGEVSDAYKVTSLWLEMDNKQVLPVPEQAKAVAKKEA